MIKTGIIRRFDDLGRITIPLEARKQVFGKSNTEGIPMEIFCENNTIILKPAVPEPDEQISSLFKQVERILMNASPHTECTEDESEFYEEVANLYNLMVDKGYDK